VTKVISLEAARAGRRSGSGRGRARMAVTIEINLRRRVVRLPAAAGELFDLVAAAISEVHPDWRTVDIRIRNRAIVK